MPRAVLDAMWPYLTRTFGNPSSHHEIGRVAGEALTDARSRVAGVLLCRPAEVIFTSGGTESDNLAIKGTALARPRGRHIVASAVEHKAVLETCAALARQGFEVTLVPVDAEGLVSPDALAAALRTDTTLVSVMLANNEVGTIQPVAEIAAECRSRGIPLHTDAVQAPGLLPVEVGALGVDLLSLSGHKFGGPKGIGVLYARRGLALAPVLDGGGQERGRRSGTENVAGAVGLAAALEIAETGRAEVSERLTALRDRLTSRVLSTVPGAILTGSADRRMPHHASFCFEGVNGETVLLELELAGVCCSSGSSCSASSTEPSHVLTAMGVSGDLARTAVRFTLGRENTEAEIDRILELVPRAVERVRALAS